MGVQKKNKKNYNFFKVKKIYLLFDTEMWLFGAFNTNIQVKHLFKIARKNV